MTRAVVILFLALTLSGCVGRMPVLQKRSYDFKSTALFRQHCDEDVPLGEYEIALNRCNSTRLLRMIDTFLTIQEADRTQGIPGDTLVDVRQKGFTIYIDEDKKIRRPNTRVLHGNEALAAVGMAVSPPPLQKPEEIRAYADFMAQHYAEEYIERDMTHVADRFCLNTRNSLDIGEDRVFTIVWREGLVFKRVIGGGPVSNPKQERALLVCPGDFLIDTLTGTVNTSTKAVSPIK